MQQQEPLQTSERPIDSDEAITLGDRRNGGEVSGNCGVGDVATRWIQQELFSAKSALCPGVDL